MIQWIGCGGRIADLVEKLNREGLNKDNIVQILVERFSNGAYWYTVLYEVDK